MAKKQQTVTVELLAADMATITGLSSTQQIVQLGSGGDAVLEVDFLAGSIFHVHVGGRVYIHNNPGYQADIHLLLNGSTLVTISPTGNNATSPFFIDVVCFYEPNSQNLMVIGDLSTIDWSGGGSPTFSHSDASTYFGSYTQPVTADFKVGVQSGATDSSATFAITKFVVQAY